MNNNSDTYLEKKQKETKKYISKNKCIFLNEKGTKSIYFSP